MISFTTNKELLSEDLYYGHTGGYVDNKASLLEKLQSGLYSYHFIKAQVNQVTAIGKKGLLINGALMIEANAAGEKKAFHAIYLAVWKLEAKAWQFHSLQAALIKK